MEIQVTRSLNELNLIRQSLDSINIQGKDAKFVAFLQAKVEQDIIDLQNLINDEENKKQLELLKLKTKNK